MSMKLKLFYLAVALVMGTIGYRGLKKPTTQQNGPNSVDLSCVEFSNQADADRFNKTGVAPAGSKISNKPASECKGVRIASK